MSSPLTLDEFREQTARRCLWCGAGLLITVYLVVAVWLQVRVVLRVQRQQGCWKIPWGQRPEDCSEYDAAHLDQIWVSIIWAPIYLSALGCLVGGGILGIEACWECSTRRCYRKWHGEGESRPKVTCNGEEGCSETSPRSTP